MIEQKEVRVGKMIRSMILTRSTISISRLTRIVIGLLTIAMIGISTAGCAVFLLGAGAGAGAGGAIYVMGKLEDEVNASVPALRQAAIAALKDLDMPIVNDRGDKLTATVESRTADGKRVWITIDSMTPSRSKVSIRVGYMGDETRARRILETMRRHI